MTDKKHKNYQRTALAAAIGIALGAPPKVWAQSNQMEEITVTATRRA